MTYEFVIGTSRDNERLVFELKESLRWIEEKRYGLDINNFYSAEQNLHKVKVGLQDNAAADFWSFEDVLQVMKRLLAENLAEYILEEFKEQLIWKEINKNYKKLAPKSKKNIFNKTLGIVDNAEQNDGIALLLSYRRKYRTTENIITYMQTNNYMHLEGYMQFGMRDFTAEIKRAANTAQKEFTGKAEYYEFISLLHYFAEQQIPEFNEINLLITGRNKFYIWNAQGQEIKEEPAGGYQKKTLLKQTDLGDALVSILLALAPRRIVIHHAANGKNNQWTDLIRNIFSGRVSECNGCEKCLAYQKISLVSEDK
ncbi:MAG: putative sporulation protein YtxC [Syntrophomonadaceae bacterium]|jgi:putative sporulation protein YtxC|nr:putative sporulation protein YtxC [Syntrophomonadaceae bacterium]